MMDLLATLEKNGFPNFAKELVLWDGMPSSLLVLTFPSFGSGASHLQPMSIGVASGSGPQRRRRTWHDLIMVWASIRCFILCRGTPLRD